MIAGVYSELVLPGADPGARRLIEDFDRAYALEAMARANAVAGNRVQALDLLHLAEEAGQAIAYGQSKHFFLGDLNGGDWHGLR